MRSKQSLLNEIEKLRAENEALRVIADRFCADADIAGEALSIASIEIDRVMSVGDLYEFPDGTVRSNAGDCAQAWADEARRLNVEVEALKIRIKQIADDCYTNHSEEIATQLNAALRDDEAL